MLLTILKPEQLKTTAWSGGTTTELYIFPPTSNYQKRDFDFRISSAKVEVEKSEFTPLKGFSRQLMLLEGSLQIDHKSHHSITLKPFQKDIFEGDWQTSALGTCTDFNLMLNRSTSGDISSLMLGKNESQNIELESCRFAFIYVFYGSIEVNSNLKLEQGDFLIIQDINSNEIITLKSCSASKSVMTKIEKN